MSQEPNFVSYWFQTVGDRLTSIAAKLRKADGTALDLTGCTVAFRMVKQSDSTVKINNAAATVDSATAGTVSYAWAAIDVDAAGTYVGYWIVTNTAASKVDTYPPDGQKLIIEIVEA